VAGIVNTGKYLATSYLPEIFPYFMAFDTAIGLDSKNLVPLLTIDGLHSRDNRSIRNYNQVKTKNYQSGSPESVNAPKMGICCTVRSPMCQATSLAHPTS
jgi:hypothetical protein